MRLLAPTLFVAPLFAATLVAAGCHRKDECAPGSRARLELRNGSGATTLAWKGVALCDGQLRRVGSLEEKKGVVTLKDADGRLTLELTRQSDAVGQGRDEDGPKLRLYRDARELKVLRGDGVPLGSVVPDGVHAAVVYSAASSAIAKVSLRDRDAVVTDMAGTALTYVVPSKQPAVSGVFAVPNLSPAEQLAIYIYWSR